MKLTANALADQSYFEFVSVGFQRLLVKCKYGTKRRNIVELAEVGDWIAGTGGADLRKRAGNGKLIYYAMRVDEIISLGS